MSDYTYTELLDQLESYNTRTLSATETYEEYLDTILDAYTSCGENATAASTSATAAETAQTAAETAQEAAETAISTVSTSETSSETYATEAAASATSAATSATTCTTKAASAIVSEQSASDYADAASTSATSAETAQTAAETAQTAAETAQVAAETAQAAAELAETNAESAATTAVADVQTDLTTLETTVSTLSTDVDTIDTTVTEIETALTDGITNSRNILAYMEDFTTQTPSVLDTALQITFGTANTNGYVNVDAAGLGTCVIAGNYTFVITLQIARTTTVGTAYIYSRVLQNSTQSLGSALNKLDAADTDVPAQFILSLDMAVDDTFSVELMVGSEGVLDGNLETVTPTNTAWSAVPSARLAISQDVTTMS